MGTKRLLTGVAAWFAILFAMPFGARSQEKSAAFAGPDVAKNAGSAAQVEPFDPRDLSGVWMQDRPRLIKNVDRYWIYELNLEEPPMTEWGLAQYHSARTSFGTRSVPISETNDPVYKSCAPPGFPRAFFHAFPLQIVQTPGEVLMLFEWDSMRHQIFTDGRKHDETLGPLWMGDSIGRWEGDTLVADTVNFNDKTWLDRIGHPHSDKLHVTEHIRRVDHDHLQDEITIEDPKAYMKPWAGTIYFLLHPKWTLSEEFCEDFGSFAKIENEETARQK